MNALINWEFKYACTPFFLIVFPIVAKIKIAKIKKDKTVYKFALNSEKRKVK